jgi:SAM-dependent methyltransferase
MLQRFSSLARCMLRSLLVPLAAAAGVAAPAQEEVPFVVSPEPVTLAMLSLARVGPRDVVLDLGSGDGRIVITAARRFGARGVGVELSPQLVEQSRDNARRAGVADRAQFRVQDLFETDLTQASVITMYLLPEVNLQLRPKLLALRPGTRIVSHDWDMAEWKPDHTRVVDAPDKQVGLEKKSRVHLWTVPASLGGTWCARQAMLRLEQTFQLVQAQFSRDASTQVFDARIEGAVMHAAQPHGRLRLALHQDKLRVDLAQGPFAALRGLSFARSRDGVCG